MKTLNLRVSAFQSAVALALVFTVANATALTKATSGNTYTQPAPTLASGVKALPGSSNLTSAATVSGPPSPSIDDIRDIRQPRHLPTPWLWVVIAAGVAALGAAAFAAWRWVQHGKYFEMVPGEIALQRLEEARRLMDPDQAREYCFAVSRIIRSYLEDQWHLHAPRLTTEEFLRGLVEGSEKITASHRVLLGDFLQHCDLAKFAGWRYSRPALAEMHVSAVEFVQQSSAIPTKAKKSDKPPTTPQAITLASKTNLANRV
jgi:hypothetical protein